jgi:hypothetical protein
VFQPCFADIAHRFEVTIGKPFEVANKIGAPIPTSNHAHNDWFFHIQCFELSTAKQVD